MHSKNYQRTIMKVPVKLFILLLAFLITLNSKESEAHNGKRCNKTFNCTTEENPCWATDGATCQNFRNKCWLESENCNRKNNYEKEFKITTREKCQPLCMQNWNSVYFPVCAVYRDGKAEFLNIYYMLRHNCLTGETYLKETATRCRCNY